MANAWDFAKMGCMALNSGAYEQGIFYLSAGIQNTPSRMPELVAKLMSDRAECFWELHRRDEACEDMKNALHLDPFSKLDCPDNISKIREAVKWLDRGEWVSKQDDFMTAIKCFTSALSYSNSDRSLKATIYISRAAASYKIGDLSAARRDISACRRIDFNFTKSEGIRLKDLAKEAFFRHEYNKAVSLFSLALEFGTPSMVEFCFQVHSYLATSNFFLKRYFRALQSGNAAFKTRKTKSLPEAKKWKERGKELFKANQFELLNGYYSLAINYTPVSEKELVSKLLCNRSLAHIKCNAYKSALEDAKQCVKINPRWSKGHYRLGSCQSLLGYPTEALQSFVCAYDLSDSEEEKYDAFSQMISVAANHDDDTSSVGCVIPKKLAQRAVNEAIKKEDWSKLWVLFFGGIKRNCKKYDGGFARRCSCDASACPLERLVSLDLHNGSSELISVLVLHGALVDGNPGCEKPPILHAVELKDFAVASALCESGASLQCLHGKTYLQSKDRAMFLTQEATFRSENHMYDEAIELFNLCLELTPSWLISLQQDCHNALADIYFEQKLYSKCIAAGNKAYELRGHSNKSQDDALTWRERGNHLFKEKSNHFTVEYYSLAIKYAPYESTQLMGVLLSNRCLAYANTQQYSKALDDAKKCVAVRPGWFKAYYRLGSCLNTLGKDSEALKTFCEGYRKADTDEDRVVMASQILSNAVYYKDGGLGITCKISKPVIQQLIKDVCAKSEWSKLYVLFLGGDGKRNYPKGRGGLATGCDAASVPLNQVLLSRVPERDKLTAVLLDHGACADGPRGCKKRPLAIALEMEDYGIATTLLRHNADPSCVGFSVGDKPVHRENQYLHWKELAVKAYSAKEYSQAVRLLNLALQISTSASPDFCHQVHALLATSYFELKEYKKSVESGNECFKLKPVKSQVEASKWKERGKQLFGEREFDLLTEYYTLAIKYVPSSDKEFLATLLGNRSLAHYNIKNYQQGLEDAKSCSRFRPEWYKGYVRQGYCHACMSQNRDAMRAFYEGLKRAESAEDKFVILSQMLSCAVSLPDGISSLICSVPSSAVQRMVKEAYTKQDWDKLEMLYLGGGGPKRYSKGEGGIATGIDASPFPIELLLQSTFTRKNHLITALLENGSNPNGLGQTTKPPLLMAYMNEEYGTAVALLQHNASVSCIVSREGDTPLHEAFNLAVTKGRYHFLRILLEAEGIDPDAKDAVGNTVLHVASLNKCTKRKCDAIQLLIESGANPGLRNRDGRQPVDYLGKKDQRAKLLRAGMNAFKTGTKSSKSKKKKRQVKHVEAPKEEAEEEKPEKESGYPLEEKVSDEITESDEKVPKRPAEIKYSELRKDPLDDLRVLIAGVIEGIVPEDLSAEPFADEEEEDEQKQLISEEKTVAGPELNGGLELDELDPDDAVDDEGIIDDDEIDAVLNLDSPFENLPWEVDCTDTFWKALQSGDITENDKGRIIAKIHMLAEGRWVKKLCRRINGAPRVHGIFLFRARVTRLLWIIWELSVAFSARCSEDPEIRVQMGKTSGRVYSEIVRVWDVCTDYSTIAAKVDRIVKSHDRGLNCIVKKELQSFRKSEGKTIGGGERLPSFFLEVSETVEELSYPEKPDRNSALKLFVPPASPNDQEYHILKFYAFSSALVNSVLHSHTVGKVDFPFRVTELEHAIINLRPKPPRALILLGRSGTGKTTCCLYRLWNEFRSYWEKAITAGPHMPKLLEFVPRENGVAVADDDEGASNKVPEEALAEDRQEPADNKEEEFIRAEDARRRDLEEEGGGAGLEEVNEGENQEYEHLHQVFVTKNAVLCTEVRKNFRELSHACPAAREHVEVEGNPLPQKIQQIEEPAWPLFIDSRSLLLMMDASLPGAEFFPRAEDGTLLRKIAGWGEDDSHLTTIEEELDSEDEDEEQARAVAEEQNCATDETKPDPVNFDPRKEVTYLVFSNELWPRICRRDKSLFHPSLLWTEIRSFIKGSVEALHAEKGYLSLEEYQDLGRKRAPNFSADRYEVYALFQVYQRMKCSLGMFDEADVVHSLFSRLLQARAPDWSIHRIYVDETQDFTQAELSLLIRSCRDPNGLFFTGDTAQSIMRGIAFRFSDLKSLFFYAQRSYQSVGIQSGVRVPNRLYQLTHNYRSHAGILKLASCVVDLLFHYFPESFDRLEKDQGLFEGPKPVLLESCSFGDLAMILRGNRRNSSRIEFGAHQVVLVASEEARDGMPEELKQGLVMTIYEAKGLEFDDVLIYNFFKDSQACKEWRVVTSFVKSLQEGKACSSSGLAELTDEDLNIKSRPLKFDESKHKVLNAEFKYLYTAITRARVNVWFFDEDEEARAPMFEYFQNLGLVRVVQITGETDSLSSMFVEKSTEAEWRRRGHEFFSHGMWEVAIKCFTFSSDNTMILKSQAHLRAAEARKLRGNPKAMRSEYLKAALQFIQCTMLPEAVVCLRNAKERVLLGQLQRKLGQYEEAAKLFKREQRYLESSECYETINDYFNAVEVLCNGSLYKEAIDAVERYNSLAGTGAISEGVRRPKASRTVERLCHQLAKEHFRCGKLREMVAVLNRMPSADDKIAFLQNHGCIDQTVQALVEEGRYDDAAKLLKANGRFSEAAKHTTNERLLGDCFLSSAREIQYVDTEEYRELVCGPLERALELFIKTKRKSGEAEARMLMAFTRGNHGEAELARKMFYHMGHVIGEFDASVLLFNVTEGKLSTSVPFWTLFKTLEKAFQLILTLHKPSNTHTNAEHKTVEQCEEYFGLEAGDGSQMRCVYPQSGIRFAPLVKSLTCNKKILMEASRAYQLIADHIFTVAVDLVKKIRLKLRQTAESNRQCKLFRVGIPCFENCSLLHDSVTKEQFDKVFNAVFHAIYLNSVIGKFLLAFERYDHEQQLVKLPFAHEIRDFKDCRRFYDMLFPKVGQQGVLLSRELVHQVRRHPYVSERLAACAEALWKGAPEEKRWSDSDLFVQVARLMQLTGESKKLTLWLSVEEKEYQRRKAKNRSLLCDGMMPEKTGYSTFFHLLEDGKRFLHVYADVLNFSHYVVRRFLTIPAWRVSLPVPSIANTVSIIEHQLIACLALFARLFSDYDYPVCLPESYLDVVNFWDLINCSDKKHLSLYQAIEITAKKTPTYKGIRQVQKLLQYMVQLVSGCVGHHFNVIRDAFGGELVATGEAERTLVLALTMLCNCGKGIPYNCSSLLIDNLCSLSMQLYFPSRIREVFDAMHSANDLQDVVVALESLLQCRGERLYCLRWHRQSESLQFAEGVAPFTQAFHKGPTLSQATDVMPNAVQHIGNIDDPSEFQMPPGYIEEQTRQRAFADQEAARELAAIKIQQWYRGIVSSRLAAQKSAEASAKTGIEQLLLQNLLAHFEKFKVDIFACSVCKVSFGAISQHFSGVETYEYHLHSDSPHWHKAEEFDNYKAMYLNRILPLFVEDTRLRDMLETAEDSSTANGNEMGSSMGIHDFGLDEQRLANVRGRVSIVIREFELGGQWGRYSELEPVIQFFENTIQEIQTLLLQDVRAMDESADGSPMKTELQYWDEDDDEVIDVPVTSGRSSKESRHRRKGKQGKNKKVTRQV